MRAPPLRAVERERGATTGEGEGEGLVQWRGRGVPPHGEGGVKRERAERRYIERVGPRGRGLGTTTWRGRG